MICYVIQCSVSVSISDRYRPILNFWHRCRKGKKCIGASLVSTSSVLAWSRVPALARWLTPWAHNQGLWWTGKVLCYLLDQRSEEQQWPLLWYFSNQQRNKAAMNELTVGQKVICKHKNGRYYQCDVVQLSKETFYEVNFDDGSFSDNLFPEDIVVRFCPFFLKQKQKQKKGASNGSPSVTCCCDHTKGKRNQFQRANWTEY